jgi:hypothetical protein
LLSVVKSTQLTTNNGPLTEVFNFLSLRNLFKAAGVMQFSNCTCSWFVPASINRIFLRSTKKGWERMQINLALLYSIILTVLCSNMNTGNSNAFSIDFDSMENAKVVNTRFTGVYISDDSAGAGSEPAIIFNSRKRSTDFQDAAYGNNTISQIQPITSADLSHFVSNPGLKKFDRIEINSVGSTALDNARSNPVPEPANMLLVGSGLIVLSGIARKKVLNKKSRKVCKLTA